MINFSGGMRINKTSLFRSTKTNSNGCFWELIIIKKIFREFMSTTRWWYSSISVFGMKFIGIKCIMFSWLIGRFFNTMVSILSFMFNFDFILERKNFKYLLLLIGTFAIDSNRNLLHLSYCYKLLLKINKSINYLLLIKYFKLNYLSNLFI